MRKNSELKKTPSVNIKLFIVIFDFKLQRRKIPAFRGAVIETVGKENILFHNHLEKNFRYGYPVIQYKTIYGYPAVLCIDSGYDEILKFFDKTDWKFYILNEEIKTKIKHIDSGYFMISFDDKPVTYKLYNWFALNQDNFKKFTALKETEEKKEFLEKILTGNILSFAKGIKWYIDRNIEISIKRLPESHLLSFKNYTMTGFDIEFISNIILPDFIGLGKSVSRGFGTLIRRK